MRALILAAGRGRRLGVLTATCPKPMVRVAGRPILDWLLRSAASAGISHFRINVGYRAEQITEYFGDGDSADVRIEYLDLMGRGPEEAILASRDWLANDEAMCCFNGDSILAPWQIHCVVETLKTRKAEFVATVETAGQSDKRVQVDAGRIIGSSRDSNHPILAYNMAMRLSFLERYAAWATQHEELALAWAMDDLAPNHAVIVADVGPVVNVNRMEDLATAEAAVREIESNRDAR